MAPKDERSDIPPRSSVSRRDFLKTAGISSLAALCVALLLVLWIPDHRIILVSLACETFLLVALSHWLADCGLVCCFSQSSKFPSSDVASTMRPSPYA